MFAANDPQLIGFCNSRVRVAGDSFVSAYWTAKHFLAEVEAGNYTALVPNDGTVIQDGAGVTDSRTPITGAQIQGFIVAAQSIVSFAEANGNQVLNLMLAVSVNGNAAF